ncbi:MAG: hypothetical protein JWR81_5660, partial [Pseudonocardia sp.]|nr:hypothetical protein [Pseudonocardia sp.]
MGAGAAPGDAAAHRVPGQRVHVTAVGEQRARGRLQRAQQRGHHARLPGPRRTRQSEPGAGAQLQSDVADGVRVGAGPAQGEPVRREPGGRRHRRGLRGIGDGGRERLQLGQPAGGRHRGEQPDGGVREADEHVGEGQRGQRQDGECGTGQRPGTHGRDTDGGGRHGGETDREHAQPAAEAPRSSGPAQQHGEAAVGRGEPVTVQRRRSEDDEIRCRLQHLDGAGEHVAAGRRRPALAAVRRPRRGA